jgi:predicted GNAT family N-acyltransferase
MVSTLPKPFKKPLITAKIVDYQTHGTLIHGIRTAVFVNEQLIPAELEVDHDDWVSQHVLACCDGQVVGTGRLTPAGRIGRVAVARPSRRRGVGFCIMQTLLEAAQAHDHQEVILAAQQHAVNFYEKLGFRPEGQVFMEVGIAHIMMRKKLRDRPFYSQ